MASPACIYSFKDTISKNCCSQVDRKIFSLLCKDVERTIHNTDPFVCISILPLPVVKFRQIVVCISIFTFSLLFLKRNYFLVFCF